VTNAAIFSLGYNGVNNAEGAWQIAYCAMFDTALTSAMRVTFWRAFNANGLGTDPTYIRANPLVTRITNIFGNVACYGANQPAIGYNANASAGDNPLELGVVCEDGASFLGLGSTNMAAYVGTNAAVTATDGPSGMRDACRVADTDAVNAGYATSGSANLVGATNVAHIFSAYVKSGGVGTNAYYYSYFTGDGGGPELIQNWGILGAVLAVWRPFIGGVVTPVGPAHTAVVTRLIPTDNVGASLGTVDFAEVWGMANATADRATWRRAAAGAASATGTPSLSYTNVANARYSPTRGRLTARVCGWAKKEEALIGTYAAAGGTTRQCCYSPGAVWVTSQAVDLVRKLNADTGALIGDYATGNEPQGVCYDPTTNSIWIGNYNAGGASTVTKLNASTGALIGSYAVGNGASGICTDGTNIWVACWVSGRVYKLLAATGAAVGNYATGVFPAGCCYASGSVWITNYNDNTITKLTAATGALVGTYATGANPAECCYDGTRIWIANIGARTITALTEASGALVASYNIAIAAGVVSKVMFDGAYVWVDCYTENVVAKVTTAGAVVAKYAVGAGPIGCCWDGRNVWVTAITANTATKLGARQVFLACGAEATQGALWLDYEGDVGWVPLMGTAPQLRLRLWDDAAALVCDLDCGTLTVAEAIRTIEWDAVVGKVGVFNGATVLASYVGAWTPETAVAVAPLYVGSDATPANAANCLIELLNVYSY